MCGFPMASAQRAPRVGRSEGGGGEGVQPMCRRGEAGSLEAGIRWEPHPAHRHHYSSHSQTRCLPACHAA